MYKGYRVVEEVIKGYDYPQVDIVVQAPCGCQACEDQVQPGHSDCNTSPSSLKGDKNVSPFNDGRWYWSYHGPVENIDEWLDDPITEESDAFELELPSEI